MCTFEIMNKQSKDDFSESLIQLLRLYNDSTSFANLKLILHASEGLVYDFQKKMP